MVDTKPLLKGFGAAADVVGQIATDKAVNSRRVRSNFLQFDITQGQLIEDGVVPVVTPPVTKVEVPHRLGRVPVGAIVLKSSDFNIHITEATERTVTVDSPPGTVFTIWVV